MQRKSKWLDCLVEEDFEVGNRFKWAVNSYRRLRRQDKGGGLKASEVRTLEHCCDVILLTEKLIEESIAYQTVTVEERFSLALERYRIDSSDWEKRWEKS
jgi:hypothetical protein